MSNCISFWAIFFPDELFGYRNSNRRVISQLRAQPWLCQASTAFWRPTGGFSPTMLWRNLQIVNLQTHQLVVYFLLCSFRSQIGPQSSLLDHQSAQQAIFSNLCREHQLLCASRGVSPFQRQMCNSGSHCQELSFLSIFLIWF